MPNTSRVVTPQRYAQGFSYQGYLAQVTSNRERYQENEAAFKLSAEDADFFKDTVGRLGGVKVLAIVEDWCPGRPSRPAHSCQDCPGQRYGIKSVLQGQEPGHHESLSETG